MGWKRRVGRGFLWLGVVVLVLLLTSFGYEVVRGSNAPLRTLVQRLDASARHLGILKWNPFFAYEAGKGGSQFGDPMTSEFVKIKRPRYALGFWPVGMQMTAREIRYDGSLDFSAMRLVWWSGSERHVVDTADRVNGRLTAGATFAEVSGWIPFEASGFGVECFGTSFEPAAWRESWSEGDEPEAVR